MSKLRPVVLPVVCFLFLFLLLAVSVHAQYPTEPIKMKLGKMPTVSFSHATHVDKRNIDCTTCHHKNPDNPAACTTCHDVQQVKNGAPVAREAFHMKCRGCHEQQAQKGVKAPTKCLDCHRK